MADAPEPDADGTSAADAPAEPVAPDAADEPVRSPRRARGGLDGRTIAIAAVLGVAAMLLTLLAFSAIGSDGDDSSDAMQLQDPAALLEQPLTTPEGATTSLDELREDGEPALVNLWQSTCVPCIDEMPMLDAAQDDNPDVTFLGVNTQETVDKAEKLAKQTGITYPWVLDPDGELYYEAGGQGMPTTLLLDGAGTIITTKTGPFKDAAELQAFLDKAR